MGQLAPSWGVSDMSDDRAVIDIFLDMPYLFSESLPASLFFISGWGTGRVGAVRGVWGGWRGRGSRTGGGRWDDWRGRRDVACDVGEETAANCRGGYAVSQGMKHDVRRVEEGAGGFALRLLELEGVHRE